MALTRKLTKSLTRSLTRKLTGDELNQLFLEKFSASPPIAAFSLRKLGNVSPYACRIRRSSDNTEAQVMFDASDRVSESSVVRNTSQNLLSYSEQLDNSAWSANQGATVTLSNVSDPFGGTNSYEVSGGLQSFGGISDTITGLLTTGKNYVYSIYLKKGTSSKTKISYTDSTVPTNLRLTINWADDGEGTINAGETSTADLIATSFEEIGTDGWYRASIAFTAVDTNDVQTLTLEPDRFGNGKTVLAFGAMLEEAATYEAVGTEKVTDGGFDDATQWAKSSSITIASGQAGFISSAENDFLQQNIGAVNGRKYKVNVTVTAYGAGAIAVRYPINKTASVHHINSVGTHTIEGVADQNNVNIQFQAKGSSTTLTIDNLSVSEHKPIPSEYVSTPPISNDGLTFNETTLDDFVGSGDAHVVTFYNQTGGEDIIQDDQNKQPKLYSSGQLVKANASPAIQFDGTDDIMKFSPDGFANNLNLNSLSSFLVFKADNISGFDYVFNLGTNANDKDWFLPFINGGNFVVRYGTNDNNSTPGNTNVNLMSGVAGNQSGKFKAFLNNTQIDIRDVENNSSDTGIASVGGLETTSNQFEGKILEIIVFDTEQHTTRVAIEADIADFHNITLS